MIPVYSGTTTCSYIWYWYAIYWQVCFPLTLSSRRPQLIPPRSLVRLSPASNNPPPLTLRR